jgi:flagellar export protein FliJ
LKRFVFTLQSVLAYKQTVEKKQKAELAEIRALLQRLRAQDAELDAAFERTGQSLERALREQKDVPGEMARHDAFFRRIRDEKAALAVKIALAEQERIRRQEALIATMKEIKTLENLKEEQYALYLEETAQEEAKELGDLISFKANNREAL